MSTERYPFHHVSEVDVRADAARLFAHLDDHRQLAGHMQKPSLMMAGAVMRLQTDMLHGKAVGSLILVTGRVLGLDLRVEEVVIDRAPSLRKTWETVGDPRLLVIGPYRMGFSISPAGDRSHLTVFIDYQLPHTGLAAWLVLPFAKAYAAWCTSRMATDAAAAMTRAAVA